MCISMQHNNPISEMGRTLISPFLANFSDFFFSFSSAFSRSFSSLAIFLAVFESSSTWQILL